jgi:transcriptional regulator with XRE-family HTH domain
MKIEALRIEKSWTQEDLAEASGLNVRTIQRAESGQTISGKSLNKVATALSIAMNELDISHVSLDIDLIDRKLATQFRNVRVSQKGAATHIELNFGDVMSNLKLLLVSMSLVILGYIVWNIRSMLAPPPINTLWAILPVVPFVVYSIMLNLLGKITIDVSPELLRHQFHIGSVKLIDKSYEADLLSGFEVCRRRWPLHTMYSLQFLYGFKNTRINMAYFEAETRFVMGKIENSLEPN